MAVRADPEPKILSQNLEPSKNTRRTGCNELLGGSWGLVSRVMSTLTGVTSNCNYSCPDYNRTY